MYTGVLVIPTEVEGSVRAWPGWWRGGPGHGGRSGVRCRWVKNGAGTAKARRHEGSACQTSTRVCHAETAHPGWRAGRRAAGDKGRRNAARKLVKRGRPRGFYSRVTSGDDPAEAREGEAEDVVGVLRARVVAMMSGRPEDVRLVLRSAEALMRAELTERRLRPPVRQELAENIQRVLDSLGSQLLPAEYPGGSPPDTK